VIRQAKQPHEKKTYFGLHPLTHKHVRLCLGVRIVGQSFGQTFGDHKLVQTDFVLFQILHKHTALRITFRQG
jgi:hypothetical protein